MEELAKLLADMIAEQQETNRLMIRLLEQFSYPIAVREARSRGGGF